MKSAEIIIKEGDITIEDVCAVVNAANSSLMGGGGVDGAIHRAGGPEILKACRDLRRQRYPEGLPTGEAVATTAGRLPAEYVIHTVGPVYAVCQGDCAQLLKACYTNSLSTAYDLGCRTIAFPAISTGVYGYPPDQAATIAYGAISEFISRFPMQVRLIFHSEESLSLFKKSNGL